MSCNRWLNPLKGWWEDVLSVSITGTKLAGDHRDWHTLHATKGLQKNPNKWIVLLHVKTVDIDIYLHVCQLDKSRINECLNKIVRQFHLQTNVLLKSPNIGLSQPNEIVMSNFWLVVQHMKFKHSYIIFYNPNKVWNDAVNIWKTDERTMNSFKIY